MKKFSVVEYVNNLTAKRNMTYRIKPDGSEVMVMDGKEMSIKEADDLFPTHQILHHSIEDVDGSRNWLKP